MKTKEKIKCPHCEKEFNKFGIKGHIWKMHGEGKNHDPNRGYKDGTRKGWNKGLTKETDERVKKSGKTLSKRFKDKELIPQGCCSKPYLGSKEHKINSAKGGGYKEGAGRSKKFYVRDSFGKQVCLQSSYELKCSEILNELGITWIRPKHLKYNDGIKNRKYFPDFLLVDFDIYLDPKNNYLITQDTEKIRRVKEQNNVNVLILSENMLNITYLENLVR